MSDSAFIARFLPRYPEWREQPGAADPATIVELAREFRLATRMEIFRSYESVLRQHRAGQGILVQTEHAPEQIEPTQPAQRHVMLLVAMNEETFTLWCPYPSGNSETLPMAARRWWDQWLSIGMVLQQADSRSSF